MAKRRISNKQKAFINEYVKCWNVTQAAKKAGYSEKTARQAGHRLFTKDYISKEIARRVREMCMSGDEALKLLSEQAKASLMDVGSVDEKGRFFYDFAKAKENKKLHLIKSIIPTASGTKVELHSSQRALELIGKAQGLFTDVRVEHKIKPVKITFVHTIKEPNETEEGE